MTPLTNQETTMTTTDPTNPSPAEPAPKGDGVTDDTAAVQATVTGPKPLTIDDMKRGAKTNLDAALSELQLALDAKKAVLQRVATARKAADEARSIAVKLGVASGARPKPKAAAGG